MAAAAQLMQEHGNALRQLARPQYGDLANLFHRFGMNEAAAFQQERQEVEEEEEEFQRCPAGWQDDLYYEDENKFFIGKKMGGVNTFEVSEYIGVKNYMFTFIDKELEEFQIEQGDYCFKRVEVPHGWKPELTEDDKGKRFRVRQLGTEHQVYEGEYIDEYNDTDERKTPYYLLVKDDQPEFSGHFGYYCYREIEELPAQTQNIQNNDEGENLAVGGRRLSRLGRRLTTKKRKEKRRPRHRQTLRKRKAQLKKSSN